MIEDKGAYRVQPAPQPFSIRSESKILANEKGRNQKLRLFNLGRQRCPEKKFRQQVNQLREHFIGNQIKIDLTKL